MQTLRKIKKLDLIFESDLLLAVDFGFNLILKKQNIVLSIRPSDCLTYALGVVLIVMRLERYFMEVPTKLTPPVALSKTQLVQQAAEMQERALQEYADSCLSMSDQALLEERDRLLSQARAYTPLHLMQRSYIVADLIRARGLGDSTELEADNEVALSDSYESRMLIFLGAMAILAFGYHLLGTLA